MQIQNNEGQYIYIFLLSVETGHRPGVPKIGILITDGYSSNKVYTRNEAKNARLKGIKLFAIGIGNSLDTTELQSVASEPKSQFVFTAASFDLLKSIKTLVMTKACEGKFQYIYRKVSTDQIHNFQIRKLTILYLEHKLVNKYVKIKTVLFMQELVH